MLLVKSKELLKLKAGCSPRLFWYFKSYENIKSKYRREAFEEFKNIMLGETSGTCYQNSDFRRFVLEPAFKEIVRSKAFTDSNGEPTLRYELERKGRIVTHIQFNFSKPTQWNLFDKVETILKVATHSSKKMDAVATLLPDNYKRPYERLILYGLTEAQAKIVIEKVPLVELNNAIIVDKIHLKLNRTAGQHSVIMLKEKFSAKYKLWLSS